MTWEQLVDELRDSPTDLAGLVRRVGCFDQRLLVVSAEAIQGWTTRDPDSWRMVREWLEAQGVTVDVVTAPSAA